MESKELRIGNFILRNDEVFEIWDLKRKELELDSILLDRHVNYETYDNINPIPLTEEWLVRFGFQNISNGLFANKIHIRNPWDGKFELRVSDGCDYVQIKSVHQLQNLYYALTGEELTIKQ